MAEPLKIADCVENAIADIAMVFHWRPDDFDQMSLLELMEWREKARVRYEQQQPSP
ncbi:GpE family phage tail protein [Lonepinella sp. BR2357]|uniref:GpE family phage tail protein n=1 Tax=Lonepinella sp. BR2357 TaxID=3434549 RepID=UPI003F6E168B